jgi:hypothetical protein
MSSSEVQQFEAREALKVLDGVEDRLLDLLQIAEKSVEMISTAPVGMNQKELADLSTSYFSKLSSIHTDLSLLIPHLMVPMHLIDTKEWGKIEKNYRDNIIHQAGERMKTELDEIYANLGIERT